MPDSVNTCDNY